MGSLGINVPDVLITQIKVFTNQHLDVIEQEVNDFCKTKAVFDIKFQFCEWDCTYKVIVLYRAYSECVK